MNASCLAETAHCEACGDLFDRADLVPGAERTLCPGCWGEDGDHPEADDHAEEDDHQGEVCSECTTCGRQFEPEAGSNAVALCWPCLEASGAFS